MSKDIPAQVTEFRRSYRDAHVPQRYSGPLHFATTITLSLVAIAFSIYLLEDVQGWEWLTLPVTFLYANLVEYFGHRGPMHHPVPGLRAIYQRHTRQHHRFFTHEAMQFDSRRDYKAVLFPATLIVFYLVCFALPVGVLLGVVASTNVAALFVAMAVGYFLNYELLHFAYHTAPDSPIARIPFMSTLRRLHTRHHDPRLMQTHNFNITYPIGDLVFGTLYRPSASAVGGPPRPMAGVEDRG